MKKIITTAVAAFALIFVVSAQRSESMKIGIKGGYLNSHPNSDDNIESKSSFYVGGLLDLALFKHLHIQPELLYSEEGGDNFKLNYINIPILAKFYLGDALSIHAGPQISFLAGGDAKDDAKSTDWRLCLGGAFEFKGGLFIDARYNYGLTDVSDSPGDTKSGSFMAGLGYRFGKDKNK